VWPRRPLDWAELAREAGYADQAHLVCGFCQLTGTTPDRLGGPDHPTRSDGEQVNSVQDPVAAGS
jgi:AraC-like DNA-binding protein